MLKSVWWKTSLMVFWENCSFPENYQLFESVTSSRISEEQSQDLSEIFIGANFRDFGRLSPLHTWRQQGLLETHPLNISHKTIVD